MCLFLCNSLLDNSKKNLNIAQKRISESGVIDIREFKQKKANIKMSVRVKLMKSMIQQNEILEK